MTACTTQVKETESIRRVVNIDNDWLFTLTDYEAMPYPSTGIADSESLADVRAADGQWRHLNVPHDWAIEGEFSEKNPSGTGGGALPGGIGWYRKHFTLADLGLSDKTDGQLLIRFDGVYMNSTVWLNGHKLGNRPYGYISFEYDMTPYINKEGENVLAVRVDNSDQPNSRWYSGCGIFRSVYVTAVNPVHIVPWDTYVLPHAPLADAYHYGEADSLVITLAGTEAQSTAPLQARVAIYNKKKKAIFTTETFFNGATAGIRFRIPGAERWSVENPYLYTASIELIRDGSPIDDYAFRFGIRDFVFNPEQGFSLNGKPMKLNGVCLHHDLGCLGSAVNRRAVQRQLEIMRGMGVNAVRCSHNPPSQELLELCDEMGFLVMDEAFDMWYRRKTQRDYARFFTEWHERDLGDLVRRDRNHPSVVMWSIGNEVLE